MENRSHLLRSFSEIYPSLPPLPSPNLINLDHHSMSMNNNTNNNNNTTLPPNPNAIPLNPNFADFVPDPSFLADDFSFLGLSPNPQPRLRSPAAPNSATPLFGNWVNDNLLIGGGARPNPNPFYPSNNVNGGGSEFDLHRRRVLSAVKGISHQPQNLQFQRDQPFSNLSMSRFDLMNNKNGGIGLGDYGERNNGGNGLGQNGLLNNGGNGFGYETLNYGVNGLGGFEVANNGVNGFGYEAQNNGGNWYGYNNALVPYNGGNGNNVIDVFNRDFLVLDSGFQRRRRQLNGVEMDNYMYRSRQCDTSPPSGKLELETLKGKVLKVAKDQQGCRLLQKKFEEGNRDDIQMIFLEVKDHVIELMKDNFGNYFMQKFFDVCNGEQITQILCSLVSSQSAFRAICLDTHGTRAVQKLLERLRTAEQIALVISVLRHITVTLMKNMSGNHVIHSCMKLFSADHTKPLLDVIADNCMEIATDKSGCCVLQNCLDHAQGEPKARLVADITANAMLLSEDPFGNYVVQYLLGMQDPVVTGEILAQLRGNFATLSMNKFSSNVVEKFLRETPEENGTQIITELVESKQFLSVLQDPYGNYVAQSALDISKGSLRHKMVTELQKYYTQLQSHPHGKRVLAKLKGNKPRLVSM